jgi:hypothetical protein
MEHDEVLEQLELAAVEPDGLARLMAGDTPAAAAVAGHLAGCEPCSDELLRLGRAAPLLRDVVRTTPSADLRERTLAFVRKHGEARGPSAASERATTAGPVPVFRPIVAARPDAAAGAAPASRSGGRAASGPAWPSRVLPWVATLAAAVVLSVVAASFVVGRQLDEGLAVQARAIEGLEKVTLATIAITADLDAKRVSLGATDGGATTGSLLFSPSTAQLVVVADGLTHPPEGREYRCWIEVDGQRSSVGKMFFAEDLAYWVGDTPEVSGAGPGTTFGVSLTDIGGPSLEADPVIVGKL